MVDPYAVLQVADDILHIGVAVMTGLETEGAAVPAGDEIVIAVIGKQSPVGSRSGLDLQTMDAPLSARTVSWTLAPA